MARKSRAGSPGVFIDADMREAIQATSMVASMVREFSTEATIRDVIDETHRVFAGRFDQQMSLLARNAPEHYFHVYEYSTEGDGFVNVGNQQSQLWMHTINRVAGTNANFTWRWKVAKKANPTYKQRRQSDVGWDGIREIDQEEYDLLRLRSANRRYVYRWKAPMLEYGIRTNIVAQGRALFMPQMDGSITFRKFANTTFQQPGSTKGNFTSQWSIFWTKQVAEEWDNVLGDVMTKNVNSRVQQALAAGKRKPRKEVRKFAVDIITDNKLAMEAGEEQGIAIVRQAVKSLKQIDASRGRSSF